MTLHVYMWDAHPGWASLLICKHISHLFFFMFVHLFFLLKSFYVSLLHFPFDIYCICLNVIFHVHALSNALLCVSRSGISEYVCVDAACLRVFRQFSGSLYFSVVAPCFYSLALLAFASVLCQKLNGTRKLKYKSLHYSSV